MTSYYQPALDLDQEDCDDPVREPRSSKPYFGSSLCAPAWVEYAFQLCVCGDFLCAGVLSCSARKQVVAGNPMHDHRRLWVFDVGWLSRILIQQTCPPTRQNGTWSTLFAYFLHVRAMNLRPAEVSP